MPFKKGGGHHKGRKSTRISLTVTRTPTPKVDQDGSDEEMADGDQDIEETGDVEPQEDGEEDPATPAAEDDEEDDDDEPRITSMPRRRGGTGRRRGRGGYAHTPELGDDGSESGTPRSRRRGRPPGSTGGRGGRGGARRGRKSQAADIPKFVMDKEGNYYDVVDDEAVVDFDEEGEEKVNADGQLQGDREYRVRTFTILGKGDRLYMLSTEPARCCGFRDSYLFFTKHPKLFKVLLDEDAKLDLIKRGILPNSYKGRNIGVVTARSVFREFGAKIIVGGKKVTDDYKVAEARANGEVEGELVDPDDHVPDNVGEYNRNRYVAWFGASDVYKTQGGGGAAPGKPGVMGKRRNNITIQNWQFMHAREASRFNSALTAMRKANLDGVYDTNTNMMFYPRIMQPTHAKWEYIEPEPAAAEETTANGRPNGHLANGTNEAEEHDSAMEVDQPQDTIFGKVPNVISRNFTVVDTVYKAPPISNAGYPGPDGHVIDSTSGPNGLASVSQDLIDELPAECRAAFEEARATELGWKRQWGTEAHSGRRGALKIGFNGYPV